MTTKTVVTKQNLHEFEERLSRLTARKAKAERVAKICTAVGNVVFTLWFFVVTCVVLGTIMDEKELAVLNQLPVIMPWWNKFVALLPADLTLYLQILAGCVAAVILPFAVNLPLSIILRVIPTKKPEENTQTELEKAKWMKAQAASGNYRVWVDKLGARLITRIIYALGVIATPCYVTYMAEGENWESLMKMEVIVGCVFLAGLALVAFGILNFLSSRMQKVFFIHRKDKSLNTALSDYVDACQEQEEEEKDRKEKEEKKRIEQERLEEERRNKEKGAELFTKATAGDEIDEDLLQEAADLGDPQACMIIGKRLMQDGSSDLYTDAEQKSLMRRAAVHFEHTQDTPQGMLYWIRCRVRYEKNTKEEWKSMLSQLRSVKTTGDLSEDDLELCDATIRALVQTVDKIVEQAPPKPKEPKLKRKYCRFCGNGSICTYYSTGSYISLCKYPNNPGDCAAALMEKGLAFEFE